MEEIKYSIIMIANSSNNLDRALESIRKQKYEKERIEVILIDNSINRIINFHLIKENQLFFLFL